MDGGCAGLVEVDPETFETVTVTGRRPPWTMIEETLSNLLENGLDYIVGGAVGDQRVRSGRSAPFP